MNRLLCAAVLIGSAGCGLISSDVADFSLRLPEKQVTVDTEQWMLTGEETMPEVPCAANQGVCQAGVDMFCAAEDNTCFGSCDGTNCEVTIVVALFNEFDLKREVRELQEIDEAPLASISIDRIYYTVSENTFNVTSPELTVYMAPQGVMEPGSPQAQAIGVIEPIEAGTTIVEKDVVLMDAGRQVLTDYMTNYTTPFNIIVGSVVTLSANDSIPTGKMVSVIKVQAHASPL